MIQILIRRYWHSAQDGRALEKSRKRLNLLVRNFIQTIGGCVIRHSNIRASEKSLYRFDGTHLSNSDNEVYLNNIQGAIELFLSNNGPLVSSTRYLSCPCAITVPGGLYSILLLPVEHKLAKLL
jgi:hypothetical protein